MCVRGCVCGHKVGQKLPLAFWGGAWPCSAGAEGASVDSLQATGLTTAQGSGQAGAQPGAGEGAAEAQVSPEPPLLTCQPFSSLHLTPRTLPSTPPLSSPPHPFLPLNSHPRLLPAHLSAERGGPVPLKPCWTPRTPTHCAHLLRFKWTPPPPSDPGAGGGSPAWTGLYPQKLTPQRPAPGLRRGVEAKAQHPQAPSRGRSTSFSEAALGSPLAAGAPSWLGSGANAAIAQLLQSGWCRGGGGAVGVGGWGG